MSSVTLAQVNIITEKNSVTFTNTNIETVKGLISEKLNSKGEFTNNIVPDLLILPKYWTSMVEVLFEQDIFCL